MIEIIEDLPDNVVGIIAKGRVTNAQCSDVLRAAMHEPLGKCNKLRLYYEIGGRFPGAGWDDLNISGRTCQLPQWERVAIVTDVGWVRHTVNALRFLIASEIRVFTISQADEGRTWISAPQA